MADTIPQNTICGFVAEGYPYKGTFRGIENARVVVTSEITHDVIFEASLGGFCDKKVSKIQEVEAQIVDGVMTVLLDKETLYRVSLPNKITSVGFKLEGFDESTMWDFLN